MSKYFVFIFRKNVRLKIERTLILMSLSQYDRVTLGTRHLRQLFAACILQFDFRVFSFQMKSRPYRLICPLLWSWRGWILSLFRQFLSLRFLAINYSL